VATEAHCVVPSLRSRAGPGYGALILEAQEPCQVQPQGYLPVGRAGLCSRDSKAGVEARQEVPEHPVGFLQGASPRQAQLCHQPVPSLRSGQALEGAPEPLDTPLGLR